MTTPDAIIAALAAALRRRIDDSELRRCRRICRQQIAEKSRFAPRNYHAARRWWRIKNAGAAKFLKVMSTTPRLRP